MASFTWEDSGSRLFQTGIDRGVLYVDPNIAVPWSGLTAVNESPNGGDPTPYYIDGRKVLNIAAAEEFAATIEAFGFPQEFQPCMGRLWLSPGLAATDQPKQSFGFSYRTLVGNDLVGINYAYKVHVVYNALAKISDMDHSTVSDSPDALTYSFDIDTVPVSAPGYKPTSHFVFDTRLNDSDVISQLEAILYGDDSTSASLPSADVLVGLLSS